MWLSEICMTPCFWRLNVLRRAVARENHNYLQLKKAQNQTSAGQHSSCLCNPRELAKSERASEIHFYTALRFGACGRPAAIKLRTGRTDGRIRQAAEEANGRAGALWRWPCDVTRARRGGRRTRRRHRRLGPATATWEASHSVPTPASGRRRNSAPSGRLSAAAAAFRRLSTGSFAHRCGGGKPVSRSPLHVTWHNYFVGSSEQ